MVKKNYMHRSRFLTDDNAPFQSLSWEFSLETDVM